MTGSGRLGLCALLAASALASPALGQAIPPPYRNTDANQVDLATGDYRFSFEEVSIGSGEGRLALMRYGAGTSNWQNVYLEQKDVAAGHWIDIVLGDRSERFTLSGSTWVSTQGSGATLASGSGGMVYTDAEGIGLNYGAVGAAYGFSLVTLLNRAANVQTFMDAITKGTLNLSDNLDDPDPITRGFNYYQRGCYAK